VRVRVPRFDDWFRPVRRGGAPALVRHPVAGYVVAGTALRTASDDDCRFWAALSEDFSRPQVERDAARAAVEDLGCDG